MTIEKIFFDKEGFTAVGVVLALLITLSLLFTSAQVYRINSLSSGIQETADAAALGAENVVAEYYIAVRVSDALVLSMSLTGSVVMGVGIAALCMPAVRAAGVKFVDTAVKILHARNTFARKAASGLNRLQRALPFLAAANASAIASANGTNDSDARYQGFALLLPMKGEDITIGGEDEANALISDIQKNKDDIVEAGKEAEEAAKESNEAKSRGYASDCGNYVHPNGGTNRCMYERARTLSELTSWQNPLYQTVDAWKFSVALKRAKAYYAARAVQDEPESESADDQARSVLRKQFYRFATQAMRSGYVHETKKYFSAYFPLLPHNTTEMKQTRLYTQTLYPITVGKDDKKCMHAFADCPKVDEIERYGSIQEMDEGDFETCEACKFRVSSMGKVAAATTSNDTGFEYHYRDVAAAARDYQKAREKQEPAMNKAKGLVNSSFEKLKDLMEQAADMRIDANPPGRYGALAIVATTQNERPDEGFEGAFVHNDTKLGTRAAISAAVLASEDSSEGSTVISNLLEGFHDGQGTSLGVVATSKVLDLWSATLTAYADGQSALSDGVKAVVGSIPLVGPSGLGEWASDKLEKMVEKLGLQPAKLDAPKPILSNSVHPLVADGSKLSARFLLLKKASSWATQDDLFSSGITAAEISAIKKVQDFDGEVTIATVEPFGSGGPSESLTFALPPAGKDLTASAITAIAGRLREIAASITGVTQWR